MTLPWKLNSSQLFFLGFPEQEEDDFDAPQKKNPRVSSNFEFFTKVIRFKFVHQRIQTTPKFLMEQKGSSIYKGFFRVSCAKTLQTSMGDFVFEFFTEQKDEKDDVKRCNKAKNVVCGSDGLLYVVHNHPLERKDAKNTLFLIPLKVDGKFCSWCKNCDEFSSINGKSTKVKGDEKEEKEAPKAKAKKKAKNKNLPPEEEKQELIHLTDEEDEEKNLPDEEEKVVPASQEKPKKKPKKKKPKKKKKNVNDVEERN